MEQAHAQRLLEVTTHHRQELELETGRLRGAQQQAERALEAREKAHRQRVRCLGEQVGTGEVPKVSGHSSGTQDLKTNV